MKPATQLPAPRPRWIVFLTGEEDEYSISHHPTYASAVFDAQCRGQVESRPTRRYKGFYELRGISNTYVIATPEGMKRAGYGDLLTKDAA
jgi:hypothetical protein